MRKILAVAVASVFVAACGSSSSSSSSGPQRPGGSTVTGTLGGHAFTADNAAAISAGSGSAGCSLASVPGLQIGAKAIEVALTSYPGACTALNATQCHSEAGGQKVSVVIAAATQSFTGAVPPEPPLPAGIYNVVSDLLHGSQTASGIQLAYAESLVVDPSCVGTPHKSVSGLVWLDPIVSTTTVTGAVSITFDDGNSVSGNFTAPLCGSAPDVCSTANALAGAGLCTQPVSCP